MTTGDPDSSLTALLRRLEFILQEPIDFTATDTEASLAKVRILTAAATYFNALAVMEYGGRVGEVRESGLVEHAIGAAFQSFGGEDPHPDAFDKAAMLLRGITQGHPFNDGNKRTGFLTAAFYLSQMGIAAPDPFPDEEAFTLCLRISAGELRDVAVIAEALRGLWEGGSSTHRPCSSC